MDNKRSNKKADRGGINVVFAEDDEDLLEKEGIE